MKRAISAVPRRDDMKTFAVVAVLFAVAVTVACNDAGTVECPTSTVIDGHVYQMIDGKMVKDNPVSGCPTQYTNKADVYVPPTLTPAQKAAERQVMLDRAAKEPSAKLSKWQVNCLKKKFAKDADITAMDAALECTNANPNLH